MRSLPEHSDLHKIPARVPFQSSGHGVSLPLLPYIKGG